MVRQRSERVDGRAGYARHREGDPVGLVVETRCTYFAPLEFPGDVKSGLAVAKLGRSSIRYRIGVFGEGAERLQRRANSSTSWSTDNPDAGGCAAQWRDARSDQLAQIRAFAAAYCSASEIDKSAAGRTLSTTPIPWPEPQMSRQALALADLRAEFIVSRLPRARLSGSRPALTIEVRR